MHCKATRCNARCSHAGLHGGRGLTNRAATEALEHESRTHRMEPAKQRPTERSEGGSKPSRTGARAVLTEQIVVRISKADLMALEEIASEGCWSVGQAVRVLIRRGMQVTPATETREPFEEAP